MIVAPAHSLEASGRQAVVATPHPQSAIAARDVLLQGGNAIDASIAAVLTLCVVTPSQCGLGGFGGCMVAYLAKQHRVVAIDFDLRAPIEFSWDQFSGDAKQKSLDGYLAVTVPAVVAGLDLALREFGTMSFKQVSAHAHRLAEDGFAVDPTLKSQLDDWHGKADEESRRAYVPSGAVPALGERWRQPDLARLLRRLGDEGPRAFYSGEIPRSIVSHIRAGGGILSERDFEQYQPRIVERFVCAIAITS